MKRISLILFLSSIKFCLYAQQILPIRIDLDNASGGKASDIFTNVRFIPLETTSESIFGQIYKMEVTESYFIIKDAETDVILLFDRNGKFKTKIKKRKPTEYMGNFTVNREDNEIAVKIIGDKVLIYNFKGELLREEPLLKDVEGMYYFNNHTIALNKARGLDYTPKDGKKYDVVYSKGFNKVVGEYFGYNPRFMKYEYNIPYTLFNGQTDGTCMYTFPYNYTISQLNQNGIVQQYKLIFPNKYSLPNNFESDSTFTGKRKEYIFGKNLDYSKIKAVTPFFRENDYLIFHLSKIGGRISNVDDLLFSLKTGTLYSFGRIVGDSISYSIPVLEAFSAEKLHSVRNQKMYSSIPADFMFKLKKDSVVQRKYGAELDKILLKGDKKDNPIIIESTLKQGL